MAQLRGSWLPLTARTALRNALRPHVTFPTRLYYCSRRHNMSDSTSQPPDTKMEVNEDLDQSVENEINHDATQADAMNIDGANDDAPVANGVPEAATAFEQRIPAKKDATLREFLGKMDEYAPIVSACLHFSKRSGTDTDRRYLMQSPTTI